MNTENGNASAAIGETAAKSPYGKPAMVELGQMAQVTQKSGGGVDGITLVPNKKKAP